MLEPMSSASGHHGTNELVDELARVLCEREGARMLVLRAGFPAGHVPDFRNGLTFWARVVEGANHGMLAGGVQALVVEAARQYPGNVIFARHVAKGAGQGAGGGPAPAAHLSAAPKDAPQVILLCTANAADPRHRLRLEEELRAIDDALRRARRRDLYVPRMCPAVTFTQVIHELDDHEPAFVHFSGHGARSGELVLKGERSEALKVPPARLEELLAAVRRRPTLVTFATCHSRGLAEAAARHAEFAIGFEGTLADDSAPLFAATLYERLAAREDVDVARAFQLAVLACKAEGHETVARARLFAHPGRAV